MSLRFWQVRKAEFESRPGAIDSLGHALQLAIKAVDQYRAGDEKYAHLDADAIAKVEKTVAEKREWMDQRCSELAGLAKTLNPPVLAAQFLSERQAFEAVVNPVLNKPKPKPPKQEEPKKEEGKAKEGTEEATTQPGKDGAQQQQQSDEQEQPQQQQGQQPQPVNGDQANHMDLD